MTPTPKQNKRLIRSTTILGVRKDGKFAMAGDGQVTLADRQILKGQARKIRRIHDDKVLTGFAGGTADAITLAERFEAKLKEFNGNLQRSAVELSRDWRMDRALRRLEALMIVADAKEEYIVSGTGDVIAPDDGILAIGSGGPYAMAAARALVAHSSLSAAEIARFALETAADIDVFTNHEIVVEEIG